MQNAMDPRAVRSRTVMLRAARELLEREGPAAVTHLRVARQAGVGRTTVYRHWAQVDHLLLEAMSAVEMPFFQDPCSPVRPWLHGQLRWLADELMVPAVAAIIGALMQGPVQDPGMANRRDASVDAFTRQLSAALDFAVSVGELTAAHDRRDAAAILVGPVLVRTTLQGDAAPDALIDYLIGCVGTWHAPQRSGTRTTDACG